MYGILQLLIFSIAPVIYTVVCHLFCCLFLFVKLELHYTDLSDIV